MKDVALYTKSKGYHRHCLRIIAGIRGCAARTKAVTGVLGTTPVTEKGWTARTYRQQQAARNHQQPTPTVHHTGQVRRRKFRG